MNDFILSERADRALDDILIFIASESGSRPAELVRLKFTREFRRLARHPGMGRQHPELTPHSHRFWRVYAYLVVYRPDVVPLEVVDILHGSRDPSALRDRVGEPVAQYQVSSS